MTAPFIAFKDTTITKPAILRQLRAHAAADQIVKGRYWQNGKGCAVGCTIHSSKHAEYESRFGIPQMLARLEDCIFEGLPNDKAKAWPVRFMSAVQPGTDLSCVGWKFLHWLLMDEKVNPGIKHPLVRDTIKQCADVLIPLSKGQPVDRSAAESAACAAWSAAWSAARSATDGSAESAAESAACAALSAAWSAAESATSAATSAARSAESAAWSAARSAESAARSAESAAYVRMSDKLIDLIQAAPKATAKKRAAS